MVTIKRYTSPSSLPNPDERCGNGKSRKPTYKFLTGTHMSLESNVDRLTSLRLLRCAKMLKIYLNLCLNVNKAIAADIKFVCSTF